MKSIGSMFPFNYKALISFSRRLAEILIANGYALFTCLLRFVFDKYEWDSENSNNERGRGKKLNIFLLSLINHFNT